MNNTTDVTRKEKDGSAEKGLDHRVVMELVSYLSNIGYRVYTNIYYSLPTLFLDLKQKEREACGTVKRMERDLVRHFSQLV